MFSAYIQWRHRLLTNRVVSLGSISLPLSSPLGGKKLIVNYSSANNILTWIHDIFPMPIRAGGRLLRVEGLKCAIHADVSTRSRDSRACFYICACSENAGCLACGAISYASRFYCMLPVHYSHGKHRLVISGRCICGCIRTKLPSVLGSARFRGGFDRVCKPRHMLCQLRENPTLSSWPRENKKKRTNFFPSTGFNRI